MNASEITYDKVKEILLKKGYPFYTGKLNLNLIGVRTSNVRADNYDDFFIIAYEDENGNKRCWVDSEFTTDPGKYYLQKKLLSKKGCAIMVPGHYKGLWAIGMHRGKYEALVQVGPVNLYRDNNMNDILDFDQSSIEGGSNFGINCHHGYDSVNVNSNSAGCQVQRKIIDHAFKMDLCKRSIKTGKYGKTFSYTLLTESDFK